LNEWGFAAEVSKWWQEAAAQNPAWRFHAVRVEHQVPGGRQRSDLVVLGDAPALCGEIRLPDHPQASPLDIDNLKDAVFKAQSIGCRWAFTSDAKSVFLIDTSQTGSLITRIVHKEELGETFRRDQLDDPKVLAKISQAWIEAFRRLGPIVAGIKPPVGMSPDALFVEALRELMAAPVAAIRDAMNDQRIANVQFEQQLIEWMVDEQGWTHDPSQWEIEIQRAAKLTAYVFVTRLVFYESLRRSKPTLDALTFPPSPTLSAKFASRSLIYLFDEARRVSGDYETLFTWDRVSDYAFLSDACVPFWRRLIQHLEHFDLSTIDHDILGRLFERLIEPHERYEWGQHYTSSDVVDLMLSFALEDGTGSVLDPATGGGTFLVRAYARKKALLPTQTHQQRLQDLYGVDVSRFAATIATVNLASRQLEFENNYPRVVTKSFFRMLPGAPFIELPNPDAPLDEGARMVVRLNNVKALIGNPPYIRVHKLGEERQREAEQILGRSGRIRTPTKLPKSSNYHVYFWLHGAQFLDRDGSLALITSGEWMDSDYGVALQDWLLNNFKIEAFVESAAEPWFSEARVGTVVTIAKQCSTAFERNENHVRFVSLRRPLRELVGSHDDESAHFKAVDDLRDKIRGLVGHGESDDFDWSVTTQKHLREIGTRN
jgi:hypothetical protein